MSAEQTVVVRISRYEIAKDQYRGNQAILGLKVMHELRMKGVPVIGVLAVFCVEHGKLTMHMEDGLDGDEFVYTWVGVPLPYDMRKHVFNFRNSLADKLKEEEEI